MTESHKPVEREGTFQKIAFLLILALISFGFLYMVRYFVITLLMAGVFTGLSHPLYRRLLKYLRFPPLAAIATLLLLLLVLFIPIAAVIVVAYQQAWTFLQAFDYNMLPGALQRFSGELQHRFPELFRHLHMDGEHFSAMALEGARKMLGWLIQQGAGWSLAAAGGLANFVLMLFVMFYFYLDGKRILERITRWSPLRDDYEQLLIKKFLIVSRGALKGILIIGAAQGILGMLMFWATGASSPVLLGALMVVASVIPAVGAGLIWVPVGVLMLIAGRFGAGLFILGCGSLVISTVDNLLRSRIIGKDIQMHDVMVLISTLGGLALFGLPGFIIGPILAALFLSVWALFEEIFSKELARNHRVPPDSHRDI